MPNQSFSQNQDLSKEIKLKDTTLIVTTLRSHSDICAIMCYNPVRVPIWSCLFLSLWGIWGTITPEKRSKSFIYPEVKQGLYMLLIGSRSTHPPNEWKRTLRQLTSPDLSNWSCLSSPHVHCLLCYALYTFSATSFFFAPERFQAHHIQLKFMNHLLPVPPRKDLKPYSAFVDTSTRKKSQQSSEKIEDLRTSKTTHSRCLWCSEAGDLSSVWRSIKAHVSGCLRPDIFLVKLPG